MSERCKKASVSLAISFGLAMITGGLGLLGFGVAGARWMDSCGPNDFSDD